MRQIETQNLEERELAVAVALELAIPVVAGREPMAAALAELANETPRGYTHRNPVALAREWQALLDSGEVSSRAALGRQLGVSRTHVTQVLGLLHLPEEEQQRALALGDPIEGNGVGIHTLLRVTEKNHV